MFDIDSNKFILELQFFILISKSIVAFFNIYIGFGRIEQRNAADNFSIFYWDGGLFFQIRWKRLEET